eukprot:GHRR01028762.1.p2 GENE.GHRR01028762.1~~GHRR01028762.1.p2  ORF type:complete len:155 (+),score=72.97 GHRR01028762.1:1431-1895(+)
MKATFKSDYLSLVDAAGTAMAELLYNKQALAEARLENAAMVKDVGWLSAAEVESAALRRGLKQQVEDLQAELAQERKAHQLAVKQYVDALDARSAMQVQLQAIQQQLDALRADYGALQQQREALQGHYDVLIGQCTVVRDQHSHRLPNLFTTLL